jgi:hypothetical protein
MEERGKINKHLMQQIREFARASGVDLPFSDDRHWMRHLVYPASQRTI